MLPYLRCAEPDPADEGDALLYCPDKNARHTLVVVPAQDKWSASTLARNLVDRGYVVAVTGEARPGGIARVVEESRAAHVFDADPCHVDGGFGVVFYAPRWPVQAYLSAGSEAADPGPMAIAVVRPAQHARNSPPAPAPGHPAFLPTLVFRKRSTARVAAGQKLSPYLRQVFKRGLGHIDVLADARMKQIEAADSAGPSQCVPCRYPPWADREVALALVAARIDLWFRAHVEHRDKALAEVARWGRATSVAAKPVPKPTAYEKLLADKAAAREREFEKPDIVPMFSLPLLLGGAVRPGANGGGFVVGTRPELVVGALHGDWDQPRPGVGAGGYLDAVTMSGRVSRQTLLGGGATVVWYLGTYGLALSGGVDVPTKGGSALPTVGAFFGFRDNDWQGYVDTPFGVRVDARLGSRETSVVAITAQIDTPGLVNGVDSFFHSWAQGLE